MKKIEYRVNSLTTLDIVLNQYQFMYKYSLNHGAFWDLIILFSAHNLYGKGLTNTAIAKLRSGTSMRANAVYLRKLILLEKGLIYQDKNTARLTELAISELTAVISNPAAPLPLMAKAIKATITPRKQKVRTKRLKR